MKTSNDKIIDFLAISELTEPCLVINYTWSTANIVLELVERSTALDIRTLPTLEEKLKVTKDNEVAIKKCLEFPDGRGKFFCLTTSDLNLYDIQVKIVACIL